MKLFFIPVDLQKWYFHRKYYNYRKAYAHLSDCALRYGIKTLATGILPQCDKRIENFIEESDPCNVIDGYYPISWMDRSIDICHFTDARNVVVYKNAFDPFQGCDLMEQAIIMSMIDVAIVYGYNMFGAVDKTVEGLMRRKIKTVVLYDATISKSNKECIARWHEAGAIVTSLSLTDLLLSTFMVEEDGFLIDPVPLSEMYS